MSTKQANQRSFWEQSGQDGYGKAMFSNVPVEQHIRSTIWNSSIEVSRMLGLTRESKILELGSGDGTFTGTALGWGFFDGFSSPCQERCFCNCFSPLKSRSQCSGCRS